MSERDDRIARDGLPSNTAEFRAAPDVSASTAQFRAFAAGGSRLPEQQRDDGTWPEQPWNGGPDRRSGRGALIVAGVVGAIAVVVVVVLVLAFGG